MLFLHGMCDLIELLVLCFDLNLCSKKQVIISRNII
jgi:hypothetical protein